MSGGAETAGKAHLNWRLIAAAIAAACLLVFFAANTHLVYVAFSSQPDCVPHAKDAGAAGVFRAAKSAC